MRTIKLLPNGWKLIGVSMTVPGAILGILCLFGEFEFAWLDFKIRKENHLFSPAVENFTNELAFFLVMAGMLIMAFSRERVEDERIQFIRLEAFQWSFLVHFVLLILANWFMFSENFFYVLVFGMFMPLVVFLLRFHYVVHISEEAKEEV